MKDYGKIENDLTSTQWKLYEYLKAQKGLVSLSKIYSNLKNEYPDFKSEHTTWNNAAARRMITDDLNAIANSKIIQKVIIRDPSGVGFLPKDETDKYLKKEYVRIMKSLVTLNKLNRKAYLDGQLRTVFGKESEMIQAYKNVERELNNNVSK